MYKKINFSSVDFDQLSELFNIKRIQDDKYFEQWFNFDYDLKNDLAFLTKLLNKNQALLNHYSELGLMAKFIIPLLNRVDFNFKTKTIISDFYEASITWKTSQFSLSGRCDFVVGTGFSTMKKPYFFIQEFKKSTGHYPEDQLLAELITALEISQIQTIKGAYVMGSIWNFAMLNKESDKNYIYYLSGGIDSSLLTNLKQIYGNLQCIKHEIKTILL